MGNTSKEGNLAPGIVMMKALAESAFAFDYARLGGTDVHILIALETNKKAMSQVELASTVGGSRGRSNAGTISRALTRLEKVGYVVRSDGKDQRSKSVTLTTTGRALVSKPIEAIAKALNAIPEESRRKLIEAWDLMHQLVPADADRSRARKKAPRSRKC